MAGCIQQRGHNTSHLNGMLFMIAAIAFLVLTIMSSSSSSALVDAQITYTDAHRRGAVRESNIIKCMHGQTTENYYLYSKCIEVFSTNHSVSMATKNYFDHSDRSYSDRSCYSNRGYGENIAAGRATAVANFGGWYWNELPNLNPANPADSSKGVVGHLTAVVWKAATRFGMGGGWSSSSTYRYYWTHNPSSPTASTAPNMGGLYLDNVGPVSTTMNYTKCERDVLNYYNANPTTYFDTTEAAYSADGGVIISNVKVNGASTAGTAVAKGSSVTVTWTASSVGTSTFQVIFFDTGSDWMDPRGKVNSTIKTTLATGLASATRTATVTIPATAQTTEYGLVCVVSGEEKACVGGLSIQATAPTTYAWSSAAWGTCTDKVSGQVCGKQQQTRSVICKDNSGATVADSNCSGTKPATTQDCTTDKATCANSGTCSSSTYTCSCTGGWTGTLCTTATYSWSSAAWGTCTDKVSGQVCGKQQQTRAVTCKNNSGATVADSNCSGTKPATTQDCAADKATCANSGTCSPTTYTCSCTGGWTGTLCTTAPTTYSWSSAAWGTCTDKVSGQTCGKQQQNRTVTCQSNTGATVADSNCSGTKPSTTQECTTVKATCANAGTCSTTTYTCSCVNGWTGTLCTTAPTTYAWSSAAWGTCTDRVSGQVCGKQTQSRSVQCKDNSGATVADSNCSGTKPATTQDCTTDKATCANSGTCSSSTYTCSCTGGWTGTLCTTATYSWSSAAWSTCTDRVSGQTCGFQKQTRSVQCKDNTGATVADSNCSGTKPATTQDCTTVKATCANAGTCSSSTYTCSCATGWSGSLCQTNTAEYAWKTTDGACTDKVSGQTCGFQKQTRSVQCINTAGDVVEDAKCTTTKPSTTADCANQKAICQNGGTCSTTDYTCSCSGLWTGTLCEVDPVNSEQPANNNAAPTTASAVFIALVLATIVALFN